MTDRIPLDHLNSDQYDQLCDELDRARARADRLAADLTGWRNLAAEHQQATIAALERAETAEAALDRIRRLAARIRQGVPWASNFDNLAGRILTELDGRQTDASPEPEDLTGAYQPDPPIGCLTPDSTPDGTSVIGPPPGISDDEARQMRDDLLTARSASWTPPPPGDKREQLPDAMLALIRDQMPDYLSTACQTADTLGVAACYPRSGVPRPQYDEIREHADRLHERCRTNQKFTGQICSCGCHPTKEN